MSRACRTSMHEAIKTDDSRWFAETTPLGIQRMEGCGPDLELRDCPKCRSTLARELEIK